MTGDANYSCFLGSEGWEHPHWLARFYPDDLPPEWRLTYYSNFFNCTYLGYPVWAHAPFAELADWIANTGEGFRLVLAAPDGDFTKEDNDRLETLKSRIGIVCSSTGEALPSTWSGPGEALRLTGNIDLKSLAKKLQSDARYSHPLYLIHSDANISELEKLKTLLSLLGLA